MLYQLPNGKVVHLSIDEYLDLTDEDVQYLMSLDYGEHIRDPFRDSAVSHNTKEKYYDFEFLAQDDETMNDIISDDNPIDDIIDLSDELDM
jgi:hypothetical protein|tara:strand:- start:368 stop:640 length:273 start_codon:yes stop_codon:yes gene_type:complete